MKSSATTVEQYLESLPADRRDAIATVRKVVKKNLPKGFEEAMNWGMISYQIPFSRYSTTYNKQPLMYAALGSQKNYCALYMMGVYMNAERTAKLKAGFDAIGKKVDMGKSCIRFQAADDLPLDTIGELIAGISPEKWIEIYEDSRKPTAAGKRAAGKSASKSASKSARKGARR